MDWQEALGKKLKMAKWYQLIQAVWSFQISQKVVKFLASLNNQLCDGPPLEMPQQKWTV